MEGGNFLGAEPFSASLRAKLADSVTAMGTRYVPRTRHLIGKAPKYTNRLALETSPYLLQHAHNPVNWYPWSDEAFADAKRLNRPVFLSSGYSTCHWCHVMEEESFESEDIAEYLNSHYICIKLDREERPDVDAVYMSAVQAMHGSGGWPMSVWLTDKREPFFAGTYFPPRDGARGARMGFISILKNLASLYAKDPQRVSASAEALVEAIKGDMGSAPPSMGGDSATADAIEETVSTIKRVFDKVHGGLRRAPKFPSNVPVRLLLRYHRRTGDDEALHMATLTLEKMAAGGLHDQLGGGFHRYSTDAQWLAPHFEKMLYDNALLATAYSEAHQATGRRDLARVAHQTLDYVLREMTSPEGAFYSATDADSEGEEGKFFVWTEKEVRDLLGPSKDTDRFAQFYDITSGGNWEGGNILRVLKPDEDEWASFESQRTVLYEARKKRIPPLRDEKIISSWNGLMISAMAHGGRILNEPRYLQAARRALAFLLDRMRLPGGKLARSSKGGKVGASAGFLDDYAFVGAAALDLYEATLEARWLEAAVELYDDMERLFGDKVNGGWYKTSQEHEALIAREKSLNDGAEPAGGSVALLTVVRLAAMTQDKRWEEVARKGFESISVLLQRQPLAVAEALLAVDWVTDNILDVAVVWPNDKSAAAAPLLDAMRKRFVPNRVLCGGEESQVERIARLAPWMRGKVARNGAAAVYVCQSDGTCKLPVVQASEVGDALGKAKGYMVKKKSMETERIVKPVMEGSSSDEEGK